MLGKLHQPGLILTGVNVNTGHGNVNSGSVHVNAGPQDKSGASRFNTGKQHVNSGSVHSDVSRFNTDKQHVSSVRVNRPVSNNTSPKPSKVNLNSSKKCFSTQRSPVNRPFSRHTSYKSNIYAVKGKVGIAVKTSAGPQGRPKPVKAWVTRINWRILKNSIGDLLPLEVANATYLISKELASP
ncbi:hypothetical protein Tco_1268735 [Tanacetum coccineum]